MNVSLEKGFAVINRTWQPGDKVELVLPMPVRYNRSIDSVAANINRVAITRGPLVYCAEGIDNDGTVQRFFLDNLKPAVIDEQKFSAGVLKNVVSISIPGKSNGTSGINQEEITMIPYYSWNNRGDASMIVWLPIKPDMVRFSDTTGKKGRPL